VALAVCLLLDRDGERAVRALWRRLTDLGADTPLEHTHGRHVPHLSYAVLRSFDVAEVRAAVEALREGPPVELHADAVGHFRRGRVALVPAVTAGLLVRQEHVVDAVLATGAELHHYYRPGHWVPHLSVATRVRGRDLAAVTTAIHDVLPLDLVADRAALVDSGTGERWPLDVIP
jgi:2'-5' RNA ligase